MLNEFGTVLGSQFIQFSTTTGEIKKIKDNETGDILYVSMLHGNISITVVKSKKIKK